MVILCAFLDVPLWESGDNGSLEVVELFAGVGRIARLGSWMGFKARAFDLTYVPVKKPFRKKRNRYPRSAMDLNGAAGLVFLAHKVGPLQTSLFFVFYSRTLGIDELKWVNR